MKLNIAALLALSSASALAVPIEERAEAAAPSQWTITNMKRVCNEADTSCAYSFGINTHTAGMAVTPCKFTVKGANASEQQTFNHVCGPFTVGTGWVNQNGPGNGFVVLPTLWSAKKLEAYPSYSDADLNTNKVIKVSDQAQQVSQFGDY